MIVNEQPNLRDIFALHALTGITHPLPNDVHPEDWDWPALARAAYLAADAMLEERLLDNKRY